MSELKPFPYKALSKHFAVEELESASEAFVGAVGIKQQSIKERLNEVLGVMNWEFQLLPERPDQIKPWTLERHDYLTVYGMLKVKWEGQEIQVTSWGGWKWDTKSKDFNPINAYKSAEADAFKKAASRIGVGSYIYKNDFTAKEKAYIEQFKRKSETKTEPKPVTKPKEVLTPKEQAWRELLKVQRINHLEEAFINQLWYDTYEFSKDEATAEQIDAFVLIVKQNVGKATS